MALPKINQPYFSTKLPTGDKINYRPFTVREQKNLLVTAEGGSEADVLRSIVALVSACVEQDINWLEQPPVNLEHAFLHVRAKSVGEVVELQWRCKKKHNGKECNHKNYVDVDVRNAVAGEFPSDTIMVTDEIAVVLSHITVQDVIDTMEGKTPKETLYSKVKMVIHGEEVITEFSQEEFEEFADSFPPEASEKVEEFFKNQPTLTLRVDTVCEKCGEKSFIEIKGVLNFFG